MGKRHRWLLGGLIIIGSCTIPAIALQNWGETMLQAYPNYGRFLWGQHGRDGREGRDGRNGQNGATQTVFADGKPLNLDLSGTNGTDGTDAEHGESARCPVYWDAPDYNLQGANGGNGGRGGNGGAGGNGGDLTIFYQQPQDLRSIFVNNVGGESGISGRGGYGGDGCVCPVSSWRVETCHWEEIKPTSPEEKPRRERKCTTERYYCTSGSDGANGRDGATARQGETGSITLVQNLKAIPADNTATTISLDELQKTGVTLSKNIWRSQSGLLSKLASGSKVADSYREYVELWQAPIRLTWQATQPTSQFLDAQYSLALRDDKSLTVTQSGAAWLEYRVDRQGNGFNLVVTRAMQESDATQLIRQGISGTGRDLKFVISDFGKHHAWLDTKFHIKYSTRNPNPEFREGYTYGDRYNEVLPVEYVTQNGADYILHLGDLPINAEYLQSGRGVELEITAERTFAEHRTTQNIRWQGILP